MARLNAAQRVVAAALKKAKEKLAKATNSSTIRGLKRTIASLESQLVKNAMNRSEKLVAQRSVARTVSRSRSSSGPAGRTVRKSSGSLGEQAMRRINRVSRRGALLYKQAQKADAAYRKVPDDWISTPNESQRLAGRKALHRSLALDRSLNAWKEGFDAQRDSAARSYARHLIRTNKSFKGHEEDVTNVVRTQFLDRIGTGNGYYKLPPDANQLRLRKDAAEIKAAVVKSVERRKYEMSPAGRRAEERAEALREKMELDFPGGKDPYDDIEPSDEDLYGSHY